MLHPLGYAPRGGLPVLTCVQLVVSRWGVWCTLGYAPRRPSRPCLCPASCIPLGGAPPAGIRPSKASRPCLCPASSIPLGVLCTLGYASRGSFPHPPHTHPPLDLLGCIFCNSVTLLYKAHALPHSAGLTHAPENAHLGAPAGIRPSKASRPCLCPASYISRWGCWVHDIRPSGASRPCLCPASSTSVGVVSPLGYIPRGLPALACVQLAVSRWGVLHPLGYIPRRPSCPCLRPASSTRSDGVPAGIRPLEASRLLACIQLAVSRWVGCCAR